MKEINPTSSSLPSALMCDRIALEVGVGVFIMKTKICTKCGKTKSLDCFSKKTKSRDGLDYRCKECVKEYKTTYYHSKESILSLIYKSQVDISIYRNHPPPTYTKDQLGDYIFNHPDFDRLYNNWMESGYKRNMKPSIDRLDDYKGYSFDNIRLVEWGVNFRRSHRDRLNGVNNKTSRAVLQYDLEGNFVKEYYSIKQAERETGICNSHIGATCKGKQKTSGGFKWQYKKQ